MFTYDLYILDILQMDTYTYTYTQAHTQARSLASQKKSGLWD